MTMSTLLAAAAAAGPNPLITIVPWILIFVIFWMFMIRPQQKRAREHQASIMAVKKGDKVITGGGLIGKVTKVSDTEVEVDLGGGLKVTAVKSTLSQVGDGSAAAKPAND